MSKTAKKKLFNPASYINYFFLSFASVIVLGVSIVNINIFLDRQKVLAVSAETILPPTESSLKQELNFWEEIVQKYPTYRDGYIEIADINSQLGNLLEAKTKLSQAKQLDPNSIFITSLEEKYR